MRVEGFYVWLAINLALAFLHAASSVWLLLLLDMLFFRVNVLGIRKWRNLTSALLAHQKLHDQGHDSKVVEKTKDSSHF